MDAYRIVSAIQKPAGAPPFHSHIISVGTGGKVKGHKKYWSLDEVLNAMYFGDEFFTENPLTGKKSMIIKFKCNYCDRVFIKFALEEAKDNNLDYLCTCAA